MLKQVRALNRSTWAGKSCFQIVGSVQIRPQEDVGRGVPLHLGLPEEHADVLGQERADVEGPRQLVGAVEVDGRHVFPALRRIPADEDVPGVEIAVALHQNLRPRAEQLDFPFQNLFFDFPDPVEVPVAGLDQALEVILQAAGLDAAGTRPPA